MEEIELPKYKNEHYDKSAFDAKFYGDPSSINLIIDIMVDFLQNEFKNEFKNSIVNRDLEQFYFTIHKLKGSAATTCMLNLYKYSVELENVTFEDEALLNSKVTQINEEIEIILKMIKEEND